MDGWMDRWASNRKMKRGETNHSSNRSSFLFPFPFLCFPFLSFPMLSLLSFSHHDILSRITTSVVKYMYIYMYMCICTCYMLRNIPGGFVIPQPNEVYFRREIVWVSLCESLKHFRQVSHVERVMGFGWGGQ